MINKNVWLAYKTLSADFILVGFIAFLVALSTVFLAPSGFIPISRTVTVDVLVPHRNLDQDTREWVEKYYGEQVGIDEPWRYDEAIMGKILPIAGPYYDVSPPTEGRRGAESRAVRLTSNGMGLKHLFPGKGLDDPWVNLTTRVPEVLPAPWVNITYSAVASVALLASQIFCFSIACVIALSIRRGSFELAQPEVSGKKRLKLLVIAFLGLVAMGMFASFFLGGQTDPSNLFKDGLAKWMADPTSRWLLFLMVVVLAPFGEEIFFRRFILGRFLERNYLIFGVLFSSVAFALLHFGRALLQGFSLDLLVFFFVYFVMGVILAMTYAWTRRLMDVIAIHAIYNFYVWLNWYWLFV
jgi:membrane protease YdiL (CAAX protease family)